jgi:beta-glucosidase/6-phospho-beta-glucosidase/beta-galactosidase
LQEQGGVIGITLNSDFKQPASNRSGDVDAAQRAQLFQLAWFADPVFKGESSFGETQVNGKTQRLDVDE